MDSRPAEASAYEQYAVVFLRTSPRIGNDSGAYHCGSGSLVNVGGVHGILTAGHVLRDIAADDSFRMISSVGPGRFADNRLIPIEPNSIISNWSGEATPTGPDIGFVRLPNDIRDWAIANRAFYNYGHRYQLYKAGRRPSQTHAFYVLGAYGEGSKVELQDDGFSHITTNFSMLLGDIDTSDKSLEAAGSIIFYPNSTAGHPSTFKGLSGSGVWAVNKNDDALGHILIGVAYYEYPESADGNRAVIFHSVQWAYDWLLDEVAKRFPYEFKSFT